MSKFVSRIVSRYGKYLPTAPIPNAIRNDQMCKTIVKSKSSLVTTYQLVSGYAQSLVRKVTNKEKNKLVENTTCKKDFSNNEVDLKEHHRQALYDDRREEKVKMAKFAVEQHNRENGTKVEFVELWEHDRHIVCRQPHAAYYHVDIKAFDDEGKVAILQTRTTLRRELVKGELVEGELVEAGSLIYVTDTEISYETYYSNRRQCLN